MWTRHRAAPFTTPSDERNLRCMRVFRPSVLVELKAVVKPNANLKVKAVDEFQCTGYNCQLSRTSRRVAPVERLDECRAI
jgi:hypothetical protein